MPSLLSLRRTTLCTLLLTIGLFGCDGEQGPPGETPVAYQPTAVVEWNDLMLSAIRNSGPRPTVVARQMYLTQAAVYDAWAMFTPNAVPTVLSSSLRRPAAEHTDANKIAAVSQAAYQVLVALFPKYEADTGDFAAQLTRRGLSIATAATDPNSPAGIGYAAAKAILAARANDGSNAANNYVDVVSATYPTLFAASNTPTGVNAPGGAGFNPNLWQPLRVPTGTLTDSSGNPIVNDADPTSYKDQTYLTPHWGAVKPFAMDSGAQFRPVAPPKAGDFSTYTDALGNVSSNDAAYHSQMDQVLAISAALSDKQKVIAEYWADGPRSETPPGHWNEIAHGVSYRDKHSIDDDVKMYFALDGAILDSSIAAWEAKRYYQFVRPISAIRHAYYNQTINAWGGPNKGTRSMLGQAWMPYQSATFVTPPFPEYVSGHSTFSASAAEVLTRFSGKSTYFDGNTVLTTDDDHDGQPDRMGEFRAQIESNTFEKTPSSLIVLRWNTFQDAANEAGISRLYGGIHFQDADLRAREMGKKIGSNAFSYASALWSGSGTPK